MQNVSNFVTNLPNPLSLFKKKETKGTIVTKPTRKCKKRKYPDKELLGLIRNRPHVTAIIGRKGSGKSQLMLDLLLNPRGFCGVYDEIIFISPTFESQFESLWSTLRPKGISVYENLTAELLDEIRMKQMQFQKSERPQILVIFDDNSELMRHLDSTTVNFFVSNSRHAHISCVFVCQKIMQMPTCVRCNTDSYITFSACSEIEINALFKEVSVVDKKRFLRLFREITLEPFAFFTITIVGGKLNFYKKFDEIINL